LGWFEATTVEEYCKTNIEREPSKQVKLLEQGIYPTTGPERLPTYAVWQKQ
jgi:hypothetical protein